VSRPISKAIQYSLLTFFLASTSTAAEPANLAAGRLAYAACSACHLPSGEGVPLAFPPIRNRLPAIAASSAGRDYLITLVLKGISGPMKVDGTAYNGYMQGYEAVLQDDAISAVLNYIAIELNDKPSPAFTPFDAKEVARVRAGLKSSLSAMAKREALGLE